MLFESTETIFPTISSQIQCNFAICYHTSVCACVCCVSLCVCVCVCVCVYVYVSVTSQPLGKCLAVLGYLGPLRPSDTTTWHL